MPEPTPLPPSVAGRPARVMAFRVNRRPLGEGTLVVEKLSPDPFDHFVRMLAPGHEVITYGRGRERSWRVGAVEIDWDERFLTGKLGWHPRDPEIVPSWSQELKDWPPTAKEPPETLLPFGFDGEKRLLGVLHDKKSSPTTLAAVFEMILNENERQLVNPTTEWSVEPVLDAQEFIEWLHTQDVVQAVAFVARLPNPEPRAQFEELAERLERAHGTEYAARMKSKREEGLQNIEEDRSSGRPSPWARRASHNSKAGGGEATGPRTTASGRGSPLSASRRCLLTGKRCVRSSRRWSRTAYVDSSWTTTKPHEAEGRRVACLRSTGRSQSA
jgi:hypothetical protein